MISLICLMCLSSVRTKSEDVLIAVAAIIASAVGKSGYWHLIFAASMAVVGSRFTVVNFDLKMMLALRLATSSPSVCISNW